VGAKEDVREAFREGQDIAWSLPLVEALGLDRRRWSLVWIVRCLRRLLPFSDADDQRTVGAIIDELSHYDGRAPSKQELWDLSYELSFPRNNARVAICHLYRAWWYSRFQPNNQFVIAQESALRMMLEGTGRQVELREVIFDEYARVAAEAEGRAEQGAAADRGNGD
jgi:hypothetical protein